MTSPSLFPLVLLLANAALGPAESPASEAEAALAEAREFVSIGNAMRAESAYRRAFLAAPGDMRALRGLAALADAAGDPLLVALYLAAARARASEAEVAGLAAEMAARGVPPGSGDAGAVAALYLGYAESLGPRSQSGSVRAGDAIRLDALLFTGIDASGRPVGIEPFYVVSGGFSFRDRPDVEIRAKERPSAEEWIAVGDARTGAMERVPVVVVGPPATIVLRESRSPRDASGLLAAPPGDVLLIGASITDAAGNRLYRPRLRWSAAARPSGTDLSDALAERDSLRPAVHFFEPHRNRIVVPPAEKPGGATTPAILVVTASDAETGAAGSLEVRVDPDAARRAATPCALPFFEGSFEEALAAARNARRPVFAVVAAHW